MKKVAFIGLPLFLIILFSWLFYFQFARGEFLLFDYSTVKESEVEINSPVYIDYKMKWSGNGKPTINEIRLITKDGSYLKLGNESLLIEPFITDNVVNEQAMHENLIPANNYLVAQQEFNIILKATMMDENYPRDITGMEIDFTLLGKDRQNHFLINQLFEK